MPQSALSRGLGFALLASTLSAQFEHGGQPPSQRLLFRRPPTARMEAVRADLLLAEDAARPEKGALRFAEILPVDLGLASAGAWEELEGGHRIWRLRVHSPGAKSLALVFSRFRLPPGGELFVYDDARRVVRGAFTEHENRLDGQFAVRPLRGEAATLEYFEPAHARGQGELVLASVAHDYRDVLGALEPTDRAGPTGASDVCEVDVACNLGIPWPDQINSVVHIQSLAGGQLCSGVMLNNTSNDGSILILTADHCGSLATGAFTFNFELPACRSGVPACNTIVGATELVRDTDMDVQLLRLDVPQGAPPFPMYLAGWDRSDTIPAALFLIHHPRGDAKKISRDNQAPALSGSFWRILDWDRGVSEPGSSGAPVFMAGSGNIGRVIGLLDSGSSECAFPFLDDFATRLSQAWPLLEPYLDPLGTGAMDLPGLAPATVIPGAFDVTGVFPPTVPTLDPRPLRVVRILGSGFDSTAQVALDGVPMVPVQFRAGGYSFLNVRLPPTFAGLHSFDVTQGGVTRSVAFDVVAPSEPVMQVGSGLKNEKVFSAQGVDLFHADQPGHTHYCFWSLSNVPSRSPLVRLGLGNRFMDLRGCRVVPIPPSGVLLEHHSIPLNNLPFGTIVYNQSVCADHGMPLHTSNMQQTEFQF